MYQITCGVSKHRGISKVIFQTCEIDGAHTNVTVDLNFGWYSQSKKETWSEMALSNGVIMLYNHVDLLTKWQRGRNTLTRSLWFSKQEKMFTRAKHLDVFPPLPSSLLWHVCTLLVLLSCVCVCMYVYVCVSVCVRHQLWVALLDVRSLSSPISPTLTPLLSSFIGCLPAGPTTGENPEEPDHVWVLARARCVRHQRPLPAGENLGLRTQPVATYYMSTFQPVYYTCTDLVDILFAS